MTTFIELHDNDNRSMLINIACIAKIQSLPGEYLPTQPQTLVYLTGPTGSSIYGQTLYTIEPYRDIKDMLDVRNEPWRS